MKSPLNKLYKSYESFACDLSDVIGCQNFQSSTHTCVTRTLACCFEGLLWILQSLRFGIQSFLLLYLLQCGLQNR